MLRQTLNTSPLRVKTPLVLPKLWQSYSVASYILSSLREERLGEKGGTFFGKRDRVIRKNNNKRIANNTLLLYFRMLFMMVVSLYTSRVILNALGVEDFGIYNVVGGIVAVIGLMSVLYNAVIIEV